MKTLLPRLLSVLFVLTSATTWAQTYSGPAPLHFPSTDSWQQITENGRTTHLLLAPWKLKGQDITLVRETLVNQRRHGTFERNTPDGRPLERGQYLHGLREGEWTYHAYFPDCRQTGHYERDKQVGLWQTRCYGTLVAEAFFMKGQATLWRYNMDGQRLRSVEGWKDERRHGPVYRFDDAGNQVESGVYDQGRETGTWVETIHQVRVSETNYLEGKRHGLHRAWFRSGSLREEGRYVMGLRQGVHRSYWEGGALHCRGDFTQGTGHEDCYWPNGEKQSMGSFNLGKPQGLHRRFSRMGQEILSERYDKGLLHGERSHHDEKGVLLDRNRFERGSGAFIERNDDGKQTAKGSLLDGLKHGQWIDYAKRGQIPFRWRTYERGVLHGTAREPLDDGRIWEGRYEQGLRVGRWTVFREDNHRLGSLIFRRGVAAGNLVNEQGASESWRVFKLSLEDLERSLRMAGFAGHTLSDTEREIHIVTTLNPGARPARVQHNLFGGLGYTVTQYDEQGHPSYRFAHLLSQNWGRWQWFYDDGSLEKEGVFIQGRLVQPMTRYAKQNGRLIQWGPGSDSPRRAFTDQGVMVLNSWPEGRAQRVVRTNEDGELLETGLLEHGQKIGTWMSYQPDGSWSETIFSKGRGQTKHYAPGGELIAQGPVGALPDNAFLADEPLTNPKEGVWRFVSLNHAWMVEAGFKENRLDGLWSLFDAQGGLRITVEMKDGLREGKAVLWRDEGLPLLVKHFHQDLAHGPIRMYDQAGKLLGVGSYRKGVMSGEWMMDDPNLGLHSEAILGEQDGFLIENHRNGVLATHGRILGNRVEGPLAMFTPEDEPLLRGRVGVGNHIQIRFESLPTPHPKLEKLLSRLFGPILDAAKHPQENNKAPSHEWMWLERGSAPFTLTGPCLAHEALPFEFFSCLPDGLWILRDSEERTLAEWNYDRGTGIGIWRWFLPSGKLLLQRRFAEEGQPVQQADPFRVFIPGEP